MTARALALAALFVAAPALAGCVALGGERCRDPYPLAVSAYPEVFNASRYAFHVALWNCTGAPLAVEGPCDGRLGLIPRLVLDGVEYRLVGGANGTALPSSALTCEVAGDPNPALGARDGVLAPGGWMETMRWWDGTVLPPDADEPVPVPEGEHLVSVEVGRLYASQVVTVPWPART